MSLVSFISIILATESEKFENPQIQILTLSGEDFR